MTPLPWMPKPGAGWISPIHGFLRQDGMRMPRTWWGVFT